VCRSLEEAHCRGLVHRDLKPSNLMACKVALDFDVVKVLDFGLVKPTGREDLELTADGVSAGTPAYIAPEVALGEREIDGRVDIYALGCVAYYLLTGQLVFDEPTATAMSIAHVQRPAPPPSTRSELPIPPALERLVLQCLEKNPADRPQSARDLHRMLEELEDVPPWTRADAAAWWRTHLPESSTLRTCTGEQQQDTPAVVQVA
jgi:serine/threonine protein kinase